MMHMGYVRIYDLSSSRPQTLPTPLFLPTLMTLAGKKFMKVGYRPSMSDMVSTAAFQPRYILYGCVASGIMVLWLDRTLDLTYYQ